MVAKSGKTAREKRRGKIISPLARHRECRAQDSCGLEDISSFFFFLFFPPRLNGSAVLSSRIHLADSFQDASAAYSAGRVEMRGYVGCGI